jgi:hypothetical protein
MRWRIQRRRWLTVLTAMAAATAAVAIADPLLGIDLIVKLAGSGEREIGIVAVTLTSLVVSLLAWAALALLERWTSRARGLWTVIAGAVFLVSLAGPLAAVTPAATAVLTFLHVLVAAILIVGLRGSTRLTYEGHTSSRTEMAS